MGCFIYGAYPHLCLFYRKSQHIHVFEISKTCRKIVPTPRGSIFRPPRASQVPYKAKTKSSMFCGKLPINNPSIPPSVGHTPSLIIFSKMVYMGGGIPFCVFIM